MKLCNLVQHVLRSFDISFINAVKFLEGASDRACFVAKFYAFYFPGKKTAFTVGQNYFAYILWNCVISKRSGVLGDMVKCETRHLNRETINLGQRFRQPYVG